MARKLRYGLITPYAMELFAEALTIGAEKHNPPVFDPATDPRTKEHHIDALLRHLYAYLGGTPRDPEGQHHLGSVMARAMMIVEYDKAHEIKK